MADTDVDPETYSIPLRTPAHPPAPVPGPDVDPEQASVPVRRPVMQRNSLKEEQDPLSGSFLGGYIPTPSRAVGLETPPGWERSPFLPLAGNPETGERAPAIPGFISGLFTEGPQIKDGNLTVPGATLNPNTGTFGVTPDAAAAASVLSPSGLRFTSPPELFGPPRPPPQPPAPPPTLPEARAIRDAWYARVDQNPGAAVNADYATQGILDAIDKLKPKGPLSSGSQSPSLGQLKATLDNARDQPITLGDYADNDRNLTGAIRAETNPTAAGAMRSVQSGLRQHFENAEPDNVVGGQEGFNALDPARRAHTQVAKMEDVADMIYRSGMYDNNARSMQSQLRNWLTSDESSNLTDMERAAFERAQKKGALSTSLLGLSHIASPWVGATVGGVPGAVGAEGLRGGVNVWRSAIARARVQDALRVLGQGLPPPPPPIP